MVTSYKLFTAPTCPACPTVKAHLLSQSVVPGEVIEVSPQNPKGFVLAREYRITSVPHAIFFDECGIECARAQSVAEIGTVLAHKDLVLAS